MTCKRAVLAIVAIVACGLSAVTIVHTAGARTYTIDSRRSSATIQVGKTGALSFAAGHAHEVTAPSMTGTITVDLNDPAHSSVRVTINAAALRVTGKGESADDVPKVQETMVGTQVLNVQQYPTITFASTSLSITKRSEAALDATVTGQLTIRGVTHTISVPVNVRLDGVTVTATGHFPVTQTAYAIKPVSVGGVVSVKDTVNVSFTIAGR